MGNLKTNKTKEEWDMLLDIAKENLAQKINTLNGDSDSKITRLEVINHADNKRPIGRLLTLYKELGDFDNIELSYQDNKQTLKIFLR
jgi:hypothetical protein